MCLTISSPIAFPRTFEISLPGHEYYHHLISGSIPAYVLAALLYILILSSLIRGFFVVSLWAVRGLKKRTPSPQPEQRALFASPSFPFPLKKKRVITVFIAVILMGLLTMLVSAHLNDGIRSASAGRVLWLNMFFQIAVIATVLAGITPRVLHFSLPRGFFKETFGFYSITLNVFIAAFAANVLLMHILHIPPSYQPIIELFFKETNRGILGLASVEAVLFAPLAEELIFRGLLFRTLRASFGPVPAVIASSLLFSLPHCSLYTFFPLACVGAAFAYAYEKTRNLLCPVVLHMWYNALVLLLLAVVRNVSH